MVSRHGLVYMSLLVLLLGRSVAWPKPQEEVEVAEEDYIDNADEEVDGHSDQDSEEEVDEVDGYGDQDAEELILELSKEFNIDLLNLGLGPAPQNLPKETSGDDYLDDLDFGLNSLPTSFSAVDKGWVLPAVNQGECGSCAAFVSIAVIEVCVARVTGKRVPLSEQQLIDCGRNDFNNGCIGGHPYVYLDWVENENNVLALKKDYKYENYTYKNNAVVHECRSTKFPLRAGDAIVVQGTHIDEGSEAKLKQLVANFGAAVSVVSLSLATRIRMIRHKKGIFHCTEEDQREDLNHGFAVVGYGTENGEDYWLVKNSWGQDVGEKGFYKWARGENACNIEKEFMSAVSCIPIDECRKRRCLKGPRGWRDN